MDSLKSICLIYTSGTNGVAVFTLCRENDTDVAHYNFNAHQPIMVIFGRDVAE